MPAVEKVDTLLGWLLALEASYDAGGVLSAATDGVQLTELPDMPLDYLWPGDLGPAPGTGGPLPLNPPVGPQTEFEYKTRVKGSGAAYSPTVLPKDVHVGFRISGHDAAIVTTPGVEKVTYTPTPGPTGFASGVADGYGRGHKHALTGIVADLVLEGSDEGPVIATFSIRAKRTLPTDVAVPAITYATAVTPPNNNNVAFSLGSFTAARVRRWRFARNGTRLGPRTDRNAAGGHAGFGLSARRRPEVQVVIEAPARATSSPFHTATQIDPDKLQELATKLAWSLGPIGGTQYNRVKGSGPQAQVLRAVESTDAEGVVIWTMDLLITPTTFVANDDYSWVFD